MITTTTGTFKASVIIKVVFYVITIVEVIANDFAVFSDNKIAPVCIITPFPLYCRCHAEIVLTDTD